jgi:hypothetical protein
MEIPLAKLYHMLNKELCSIFDYMPGIDISEYPPLTTVTDEELHIEEVDVFKKSESLHTQEDKAFRNN